MAITFDKFTTYGNTQIFGADKSNLFVIGFDNANNNEFKYSLSNFFPSVVSAGGTSLFKDITSDTQINLKGISVGSNKLTLTANTNDISLDVNEAQISLASCNNDANFRAITAHPDTSNITKSHHIEIVIGSNTYQLAAQEVTP